jgi:hypothetical protein
MKDFDDIRLGYEASAWHKRPGVSWLLRETNETDLNAVFAQHFLREGDFV